MKLSEYIQKLQKIKLRYGDLPLVYASDDEGNGFEPVHFPPDVGVYDREESSFDNDIRDKDSVNAVCIN